MSKIIHGQFSMLQYCCISLAVFISFAICASNYAVDCGFLSLSPHIFTGFSQCFSQSNCSGEVIPSSGLCDCCVNQNGLSFIDDGTCHPCIGMLVILSMEN